MRINLGETENVEPNMAPMLDCIFLLLIFFLVATSFNKDENQTEEVQQLNIMLPDSAAAFKMGIDVEQPLVIGVNRKGQFFLNNKRVPVKKLHQVLKNQAAENPDKRIRIDGDKGTPLQHVVHLMDLCEFEGLNNIGIRTSAD